MAHNLTMREDGTAAFAHVGEAAWHKLGQKLEQGADIETWRKVAGFNFGINRTSVMFDVKGESIKFPQKSVLYRDDNNYPLGVVSAEGYHIVQPAQILEYFARMADKLGFTLETAGTLGGGKRYWALARVDKGQAMDKAGLDIVDPYLLVATSADGTLATHGRFVCERVVCQNTLQIALSEDTKSAVSIQHKSVFSEERLNKGLGIDIRERFADTMSIFRVMGSTIVSDAARIRATLEVFAPSMLQAEEVDFSTVLGRKVVREINRLSIGHQMIGSDLLEQGSVGAWLQSVTQYCDHNEDRARSLDTAASNSLWGAGANQKMRAFDTAKHLNLHGDVRVDEDSAFAQISDDELCALAWEAAE
jgi:phage/plasmid-like protein (TIGR03299 family)